MQERQSWGDIDLEMCSFEASKTPYDLALDIIDNNDSDCLLMFVTRKDIYSKVEVELLSKSFECLTKSFVENPSLSLSIPQIHNKDDVEQAMRFSRGESSRS
jgi:hypothetical protein